MPHTSNSIQGEGSKCVPLLDKCLEYNVIIKDLEEDPLANLLPANCQGLCPHTLTLL